VDSLSDQFTTKITTENVTGGVLEWTTSEGAEATASVDSLSDQFPAKITSAPLRSVLSRLILFTFTD
jgi:hypothetical protein